MGGMTDELGGGGGGGKDKKRAVMMGRGNSGAGRRGSQRPRPL